MRNVKIKDYFRFFEDLSDFLDEEFLIRTYALYEVPPSNEALPCYVLDDGKIRIWQCGYGHELEHVHEIPGAFCTYPEAYAVWYIQHAVDSKHHARVCEELKCWIINATCNSLVFEKEKTTEEINKQYI